MDVFTTLSRAKILPDDLRSTLNAQRANAVHAHLAHIHALVADLHHATLEVLLVEHVQLEWTDTCMGQYDKERYP